MTSETSGKRPNDESSLLSSEVGPRNIPKANFVVSSIDRNIIRFGHSIFCVKFFQEDIQEFLKDRDVDASVRSLHQLHG